MKLTKELIEKAKTANTAEELLAMAKAENIEMTAEEAAKVFAELHKTGELSDKELDNVSGGCGDEIQWDNKYPIVPNSCNVSFAFEIGTRVVRHGYFYHHKGTIIDRKADKSDPYFWCGYYLIRYDDPSYEDEWVLQDQVGVIVG